MGRTQREFFERLREANPQACRPCAAKLCNRTAVRFSDYCREHQPHLGKMGSVIRGNERR